MGPWRSQCISAFMRKVYVTLMWQTGDIVWLSIDKGIRIVKYSTLMLPICLDSSLLGGKHFLPAEKCPKFDQFEGQINRKLWIASIHQQNTLFWTVLDRVTQIHRAHSLVHSGQVCPDTHSLWVPVQLCPDTHSYELLSSFGHYNPNSSIILPFITRLS